MPYISKVDLARNARLFSGDTSNLGGSIKLGEDLTVEGDVVFTGVNAYTGSTYAVLISDTEGKVYKSAPGMGGGGSLTQDLTANLAIPNLGGIDNFKVFNSGTPIENIIRNLLTQTAYPTYIVPTLVLNNTNSTMGIREVGSNITSDFNNVFIKNDAGTFITLKFLKNNIELGAYSAVPSSVALIPDQFGFVNSNNPNYAYTTVISDNIPNLPLGNIEYKSVLSYNPGLIKKTNTNLGDNRGFLLRNTNGAQLGDVNYNSNTLTISGIYPFFYGKSIDFPPITQIKASANTNINKIVNHSSNGLNISFGATGEYIWFAIPSSSTSKTKWYVDALNNGNIGGTTNLFGTEIIENFTTSLWGNIGYKIYISNYPTSTVGSMELRN